MEHVTQRMIIDGLRELGLDFGYKVLVHSSLKSFGRVEGGADAVIDALLVAVGRSGTILVPTLTGNAALSAANPPTFDPDHTPCWTGTIPETFRKRPNAVRSLHPTHSVAAIGPDAEFLTREHALSVTPCDELSPYGKLAQNSNGYVLLIGVSHECSTLFHHVEEIVGVSYHIQPSLVKARLIVDGQESQRHIMLHKYGPARNFSVMEPIFVAQGIQRQAMIGNSVVRLVHAPRMVSTTTRALRVDPGILLKR